MNENANLKDRNSFEEKFNIYFSLTSEYNEKPNYPFIIIIPDLIGSNNPKFKSRCNFILGVEGERIYAREVFVGFLGKSQYPTTVLKNNSKELISADKLPPFFSILGSMKAYRELVGTFGSDKAKILLKQLNDLVFSSQITPQPSWFKDAKNSNVFKHSLMRETERFFAFHNASPILQGAHMEEFNKISQHLFFNFNLPSYREELYLEFKFDSKSILPKRINMIIGENGLGKSQALRSIVSSLHKQDEKFHSDGNKRPMINRILAIGTPGETHKTFPAERKNSLIRYRRLLLGKNTQNKSNTGFGSLIVQLVRSNERIAGKTRFEIFLKAVESIVNLNDIFISQTPSDDNLYAFKIGKRSYISLNKLCHGNHDERLKIWGEILPNSLPSRYAGKKIVPLSSGELAFLFFAVQACLFIENGTLVLLDEPETHLHPKLITLFVELLDNLLEETGSIAIIATHSAYFVREVASEQVTILFEEERGQVTIKKPLMKTFGANVGDLAFFVFEDELNNRLMRKIEKSLKNNVKTKKEIIEEFSKDLSIESTMIISKSFGEC